MRITQRFVSNNPCYKTNKKIVVKGLMLHSVGCPQPKANVFISLWDKSSYDSACVHGIIDGIDGTVYQLLPWNHRGWHCGSGSKGSGNNTHIGVEMCEPAEIKYTGGSSFTIKDKAKAQAIAKRTYASAVELFAFLCRQYKLNPLTDGVIISHAEGNKRGIASNHGDPEHLWKGLGLNYTMNTFRQDVAKKVNSGDTSSTQVQTKKVQKAIEVISNDLFIREGPSTAGKNLGTMRKGVYVINEVNSDGKWGKLATTGRWIFIANPQSTREVSGYKVQVTADALNVRSGASTTYKLSGCIRDKGVYTVIDTLNNWGALLEFNGAWICLDYTKKA